MRNIRLFLLTIIMAIAAMPSEAKVVKVSNMYMFGFSASFKDSTIYVTDIQDVQNVWMESKSHFLLDIDQYSYQLKDYLADSQNSPSRVCIVFFATEKKKAEKQYIKLMKKYKKGYDIQYLNITQFQFKAIEREEEQE